eukprot:TRINITY_DN20930_c0_g1_i1.p1 TRINITY_DN20930_c0_g1~~TRINITY_DN20930_c0_g1_i1.p1  ORF type:complete len:257 (+),score=44.28 TRINITY_DN20930_c0_g1_i1:47-772(+)
MAGPRSSPRRRSRRRRPLGSPVRSPSKEYRALAEDWSARMVRPADLSLLSSDDGSPWHLTWIGSPLRVSMSPAAYTGTKRRAPADPLSAAAARRPHQQLTLPHHRDSPWLRPPPTSQDYGAWTLAGGAEEVRRFLPPSGRSTSPQRWRNRFVADDATLRSRPPTASRQPSPDRPGSALLADLVPDDLPSPPIAALRKARQAMTRAATSFGGSSASFSPPGHPVRTVTPLPDMRRCYYHKTI